MNTDFTIRIAQPADVLELKDLFQDTVLNINRRDYSKAEVEDWASCGNDISHIKEMIRTHFFIVATNQQLQVVGFASITTKDICILCLFIKIFKVKVLLRYF